MRQGEAVFVDSGAWIVLDSVLAVAVSALLAGECDRDALVLVVAADLRKSDQFREACQRAAAVAAEGRIVTFGMAPTHPGVAEKVGEFRP
jgi:mannose-1-phosphate guanylyltransferase